VSATDAAARAEEVAFWREWVRTRGGDWPDEFAQRLDARAELHWEIREALGSPEGSRVEILDVGAGPLTSLGGLWPGRDTAITAVDPLADEYEAILREFDVTPPFRTQRGDAMTLLRQFGRGRFDLVHGRNAIDHTPDAPGAIDQMLGVARTGGVVYLSHARNEGERQRYEGMHAWNFDGEAQGSQSPRFIAWSSMGRVDIGDMLGDRAEVAVRLMPRWINVVIRKR